MPRSRGNAPELIDAADRRRRDQAFARDTGLLMSRKLIDAEIASLPQTRGLDGKFSQEAYRALPAAAAADRRRLSAGCSRATLRSG